MTKQIILSSDIYKILIDIAAEYSSLIGTLKETEDLALQEIVGIDCLENGDILLKTLATSDPDVNQDVINAVVDNFFDEDIV